jgi:hypothetical protein
MDIRGVLDNNSGVLHCSIVIKFDIDWQQQEEDKYMKPVCGSSIIWSVPYMSTPIPGFDLKGMRLTNSLSSPGLLETSNAC